MFRRLGLGLFLITLASGVLLLSDRNQRVSSNKSVPRVAILQHASQKVFEDGMAGLKEALAENGFGDEQTIDIKAFNAEGDVGTSNTIAKQMAGGGYDLLITMSTLSLQAVANANQGGQTKHVFGLVSDPAAAGVGIGRSSALDHPKHLAGLGTMQPVAAAFRYAKQFNPALKRVGVGWNSAEANSAATVKIAREVSKELGIELLEANVENTAAVREAEESLVSRGAQAIWAGGDLTVMVAMETVIGVGQRAGIPVFTNIPDSTKKGALFDIGANYHQVGRDIGQMAADVLRGKDPAAIPIVNVVPEKLMLNRTVLEKLKDPWHFTDDAVAKADSIIDSQGVHEKAAALTSLRPITKNWKLRVVELNNAAEVEETEHGLRQGLLEAKLVEGRDYSLKVGNAQADMATLNSLMDAALSENADMVIAFSSPTLQVALRKVDRIPVVFTYVATAVAAGAGRTRDDHRPNVTGVEVMGAYPEMIKLLQESFPGIRKIGTLYSPAEINMVAAKELLEAEAKKANIEVIAVPVNTSTDVADAALALTGRGIQAVVQVAGNISAISFGAILQAANKAKIPAFAFTQPQALAGAPVTLARDYEEGGRMAALLAARIMRGENPKNIPFQGLVGNKFIINLEGARAINFNIPPALLKRADRVIGQ
jgi:ABC-type uncharacterized transport system substrate-binding protein